MTYNSARYIERLLLSLDQAAGRLKLLVAVVDNSSTDETIDIVRSTGGVELIGTGANLGYSGAINVGRRALGSGPFAILNPDLVLGHRSLETLADTLQGHVGIAVPKILDASGRLFTHLRTEPSLLGALGESLFGDRFPRRPEWLAETLRASHFYERPREVAWAGAPAWVVSADCDAEVGDWDSGRFFLYSEETDYARRARDAGFSVRYEPRAEVTHHGGGSGMSSAQLALMAVDKVRYYEGLHTSAATKRYCKAVALGHLLRSCQGPGHRHAAAVVRDRSRWASLPAANAPMPLGAVSMGAGGSSSVSDS